jgi:hypothetical protein
VIKITIIRKFFGRVVAVSIIVSDSRYEFRNSADQFFEHTVAAMHNDLSEFRRSINQLKQEYHFAGARRRLLGIIAPAGVPAADYVWLKQQLALCYYKDETLLPATRFRDAITNLEEIELRDSANRDAETLGLGGACPRHRAAGACRFERSRSLC